LSISSNPGHLLWCGLPAPDRARRLAQRLLQPDMFSGYGVRTLSSANPAWNPLSYQLGSVWPHDNALIAAGMMRHDQGEGALRVVRGMLDAAEQLEQSRLPELFCGFARDDSPPVPYERANIPQAWAAAAPVLAAQIMLGLVPDAPHGLCHVAPCLPEWLPSLRLTGIELGGAPLDLRVERRGRETRLVEWSHPTLKVEEGRPQARLWGAPF
jgi:glycogen debranching enzyme